MNRLIPRLNPRLAARLPACLILCAALGALSLSPARAGSAINKCVDRAGQVTLTDQPCDANTVSSTVAVPGVGPENRINADDVQTIGRNAPPRAPRWTPASAVSASAHPALSGDMATLKQARVKMLLQDGPPRTRLALLDR